MKKNLRPRLLSLTLVFLFGLTWLRSGDRPGSGDADSALTADKVVEAGRAASVAASAEKPSVEEEVLAGFRSEAAEPDQPFFSAPEANYGVNDPQALISPVARMVADAEELERRELEPDEQGRPGRLRLVRADDFKYPLLRVEERFNSFPSGRINPFPEILVSVADHVMLQVDPSWDEARIDGLARSLGGQIRKRLLREGLVLMELPEARLDALPEAIAALDTQTGVRFAEPDWVVGHLGAVTPNDPGYPLLWGLPQIEAGEAWGITAGSSDVVVGVIDTGVDHTHPDLADNVFFNTGETANGLDSDGNGFIDDIRGWNFFDDTNEAMDENRHGSHVSGTIAAVGDNAIGITGVARETRILPIRFLGPGGSGSISDAINSVLYSTMKGVDITNNSWGGGSFSQGLYDAIAEARDEGILFVAGSGNSGLSDPVYPARYGNSGLPGDNPPLDNVISVVASSNDPEDSITDFSNLNADIAAPGVGIYSTTLDHGYDTLSGTSTASPHVAGAAALLMAAQSDLNYLEAKDLLLTHVDDRSGDPDYELSIHSQGRLNINSALQNLNIPPMTQTSADARGTVRHLDGSPLAEATVTYPTVEGTVTSEAREFTVTDVPTADEGGFLREIFYGISGDNISDLVDDEAYPVMFDSFDFIESGAMEYQENADSYGTRLRAYFVAPETGDYHFYVSARQRGEVWLSPDDQPENRVRILNPDREDNPDSWGAPSQRSAAIPLVEGQRYYLEALQKGATSGTRHIQVGVERPDGQLELPIPVALLEPFNGVQIETSTELVHVPEDDTATVLVRLREQPYEDISLQNTLLNPVDGGESLQIQSGALLSFTPGDWDQWQLVTLSAATDGDAIDGEATLRMTLDNGSSLDITAREIDGQLNHPPTVKILSPTVSTVNISDEVGLMLEAGAEDLDGDSFTITWAKLSGPGTVTFDDASALRTGARFSADGDYVLRVTVDDGASSTSAEVTVRVNPLAQTAGIGTSVVPELTVTEDTSGDDWVLEGGGQGISGDADSITFAYLEMSGDFTVLARLESLVPGSDAPSPFSSLMVRESLDPGSKMVYVGAHRDQSGFTDGKVGRRTTTGGTESSSQVSPPNTGLYRISRTGNDFEISRLEQEGIDWVWYSDTYTVAMNDSVLVGTTVDHADAGSATASWTQVDIPTTVNLAPLAPLVDAGPDATVDFADGHTLAATFSSEYLPEGPLETEWERFSGPGSIIADHLPTTAPDAEISFELPGAYVLRYLVSNGEAVTFDDVAITVNEPVLPVFTSDPVAHAEVGEAYSYTVTLIGGDEPSLTLNTPELPDWLTVSPGSDNREWILSGTPGAADEGSSNIELTAQDAGGQSTQDFELTVWPVETDLNVPDIALEPVGTIQPTTADLNADLLFGEDPVEVKVWYGPLDGGSDGNAWLEEMDLGVQSVGTVAATLTGLTMETTYFYRFVATNSAGEGQSDTGSFTTPLDVSGIRPQISLNRPTAESARIPEGVGLVLETAVTEVGGDSGQVTLLWEQIAGPGTTTWESTDTAETVAWFSAEGDYTLRLTADNGANSDVLEIAVEVVDPAMVDTGYTGTAPKELLLLVDFSEASNINNYSPPSDGTVPQDPNPDANGHYWNTIHHEMIGGGNTSTNLQTSDGSSSGISLFMNDGIGNPTSSGHWTDADPERTAMPDWVPSDVSDSNNPLNDRANINDDVGIFTLSGLPALDAGQTFRIEVVTASTFTGAGDDEPGLFNLEAANSTGGNQSGDDVGSIVPQNGLNGDPLVWHENSGTDPNRFGYAFNSRTDVDMGTDIPNQGWIVWDGVLADDREISIHASAFGDNPRAPVNALAVYIVEPFNPNIGPMVDAGEAQTVETNTEVTLSGSMDDDGVPETPGSVTTEWIQVSGPEAVTLSDSAGLAPTFTPTTAGDTVLRLIAFDGEVATANDTTVTADGDAPPTPFEQWLSVHNLDPEADTVTKDGAEVSPAEAYLMGDDPADPNDVIRITDTVVLTDGVTMRLHFQSLADRIYRVEYTDDLTSGSWTAQGTSLEGDGQPRYFDVSMASDPQRFYRIRVSFPE